VRHLAHKRAAFWTLIYGVYAASCACAKYFTAVIEGVGFASLQKPAEEMHVGRLRDENVHNVYPEVNLLSV
jgi:hypothetical protein